MTFHPGQLVRCVRRDPWSIVCGPSLPITGPVYDDRLVVGGVVKHPLGGSPCLMFAEYPMRAYDAKFFRPVTFTSVEQKIEERV